MTIDELEKLAQRHFETAPKDPKQWLSAAKTHKAGADATHKLINELCPNFFDCMDLAKENPDTYFSVHGLAIQYRLACGYAIENALKGLAIGLGKVTVHKENGELSKDITTHHLTKFAKKCKLSLSKEEEHLLQTLEEDIFWAKYPFPKNYRDQIRTKKVQKSFPLNSETTERDLRVFQSSDQDLSPRVWAFFERVLAEYPKIGTVIA